MASDGRVGGSIAGAGDVVDFRCHGCGVRFPDDAVGPGTCPRCGAIGGHERLRRSDWDQ